MTRGLVRGDRYRDIAGRLQTALEIDAGKATRIVRTEAHPVHGGREEKPRSMSPQKGACLS